MNKTTQALKIAASWTPDEHHAALMTKAAFEGGPAAAVKIGGGRLAIRHAIQIDFSDPARAVIVSERVSAIKLVLERTGTLHSFSTTSGAVPIEDAETLPAAEPEPEPAKVRGATAAEAEDAK